MKDYILNYYLKFKCIAGDCKHTCCACWETDIDSKTLNYYKTDNSPYSQTLKKGINFKKSTFKQDKNKRCVFLNANGLCEIILNLGEDKLCKICSAHPRFKSNFTAFSETGLGFCCEEATKIILSMKEKIEPVLISDDNAESEVDLLENLVIDFRNKAIEIIQDRALPINERIKKLLNFCNFGLCEKDYKKIVKALFSLEILNKSWKLRLKSIKNNQNELLVDNNLSIYCEQFLVNSLYRHISTAEDTFVAHAITILLVYLWLIIEKIFKEEVLAGSEFIILCDTVREFSAEVEYSEKNTKKLFNFACKLLKQNFTK